MNSVSNATGFASDELPLGEEVKMALKEITFLLNTVVQRVERVESELQCQKSTDPSSSNDVTPTRTKPPIAAKVSLCYTLYRPLISLQSEVRRDLVESDDRDFTLGNG